MYVSGVYCTFRRILQYIQRIIVPFLRLVGWRDDDAIAHTMRLKKKKKEMLFFCRPMVTHKISCRWPIRCRHSAEKCHKWKPAARIEREK